MDFFLLLLCFFFLSFALFAGANIWQTHIRAKASGIDTKEYGEMQSRLSSLEDRVRVLERIVTERDLDLEREINTLRD